MKIEDEIKTSKFINEKQKATINLLFTSHWLKTRINLFLKEYNLTHEQFNVMRILKGKHPERMCVKNIGARMIEKNSNVPRILDKLVNKGLVERNQSNIDKRETESTLTSKGLEIIEKASQHIASNQHLLLNIDDKTAENLNKILEKIRVFEMIK